MLSFVSWWWCIVTTCSASKSCLSDQQKCHSCFQSLSLHQRWDATVKTIKRKLLQLMVHVKQRQKNRLKCLDLPMFWIFLTSHMLLLTSNLKVGLPQMWDKEEMFKEPFLIFMGADRNHFLNSSFCTERKSGPYASAYPQSYTSSQNKHTEMGKTRQNDTNCDKVDIWETWPTYFFLLNSRF